MASPEESISQNYPTGATALEVQNDSTSDRGSVLVEEKETRAAWDLFDESAVEKDDLADDRPAFHKTVKLLKLIVYLSTFGIVLLCAVVSKGTLLFMTSVIEKDRKFKPCNISRMDRDETYFVQLSEEERHSWIWCLLFVFFVPEILTVFRGARLCIFKRYETPKFTSFAMVFFMESLHAIGLFIIVFIVFPQMDVMVALSLTNAVCLVPSFLNAFSSWNSQNDYRSWLNNILCVSVIVGQLSTFVWLVNYVSLNIPMYSLAVVSVICISCGWWENFVSDNSPRCLKILKEDIGESKNFIYLFISLWKIILIFTLVVIYMFVNGDMETFLRHFPTSFDRHNLTATWPYTYERDGIPSTLKPPNRVTMVFERTEPFLPLITAGIHVLASYLCYSCGKFVCKICIQCFSYSLPVILTVPVTMGLLNAACNDECGLKTTVVAYHFWKCPENPSEFLKEAHGILWIVWLMSQVCLTFYLWNPQCERMASTKKLFVNPMYCTVLIDQSLALNRRKNDKEVEPDSKGTSESDVSRFQNQDYPLIFACATMWHETMEEMEQLLKSIMRMDDHQSTQKVIQEGLFIRNPDYYEIEAHIFFDDAFVVSDEDDTKMTVNSYVKDLIVAVDKAASKIYHKKCQKIDPPIKVPTPYGGKLIWHLLGDNLLVVHLKNKAMIRHKKRWSQVMYMNYLLGHHLEYLQDSGLLRLSTDSVYKNTFILALDGDIDFQPNAVQLLVDLMNRNKSLGAACGRIHPVGTGLMVYYQKFEYAIGHWLQKATEHMIGCVLCSPGCFSLFRAEALMRNNTITTYSTIAKEAIQYVQFDQGEDRWLCTLLLQRGYRVEYSAASDAYTHCPETFAEFYTQRRRWAPSTLANIMDLLVNYKKTVQCNDNISRLYIVYQVLLMIGTILGPGTIFLMLVGAMVSAFGISNWQSFIANLVPIIFFILICFYAKNDIQILIAEIFSSLYALLMMAVLVGISLQLVIDGITSPSAIFILAMTASFLVAALAHPQEFWCVVHGLIYFLSVPSMYLLLALYSFINLHVVSWGTREVQTQKSKKQLEAERLQAQAAAAQQPTKKGGMLEFMHFLNNPIEEEGSISFGLANLFRCMCCTYPKPDPYALHVAKLESHLKDIDTNIQNVQRQLDTSGQRLSGFRRRSSLHVTARDMSAVQEGVDFSDEEIYDEEPNDDPEDHTYNQPDNIEYWLTDRSLKNSPIKRLCEEEKVFWTQLIKTYLFPLVDKPGEKAKVTKQLLDLRNKVVFGVLMLNSLFILIVFLLQMQKETLHIEWPLNGKANITYVAINEEIKIEMTYLQLEPINLVLVFFFTLILVVQFIAMLFHRLETLSHILASTHLIEQNKGPVEAGLSQLTHELKKHGLKEEREEGNVEVDMPIQNTEVRENANALIPNGFVQRRSVANLRVPERPKFRSLSMAKETDLMEIIKKHPEIRQNIRRMSQNPNVLDVLKRRTSRFMEQNTASATPQDTMRSGMALLDMEFGTPTASARNSYHMSNPGFDSDSVNNMQMVNLTPIQTRVDRPSFANRGSPSLINSSLRRKLDKIKENDKKNENV